MAKQVLDDLTAEITAATEVEKSAEVLILGISDRVKAAVDAAIANGATAEELKPVSDLGAALKAQSDALQAAIVANTLSA